MKKPLIFVAIFGITAVAGIVCYSKKNNKNNKGPVIKESDDEKYSYSNFNEQKSNAASTISERHSVAAQIIRDTLNEENNEVVESKHKVDFDEIESSLDSLFDKE